MANFTDVRLQGFSQRASVAEVNAWLDTQVTHTLATERVPLAAALNRVLAKDMIAATALPSTDIAARDGYALLGMTTVGASDYNPLPFLLDTQVVPNTAVRIAAGEPLPSGADAVLPVEFASIEASQVLVTTTVAPGDNIIRGGLDVQAQQHLWSARHRLRIADIGLLAALGLTEVEVLQRPKVQLVILGDELIAVGHRQSAPQQVFDSNTLMLQPLVLRDGGICTDCVQLSDNPDQLKTLLQALQSSDQAEGLDIVLIAGGTGVGERDYAPSVVAELGELYFHGVALRPADSIGIGKINQRLVVLLPGAPVACFCGYDVLAGRIIRQLAGRSPAMPYQVRTLPLAKKIVSQIGSVDYCRIQFTEQQITPLPAQGAGLLTSLTQADGFVLVAEAVEGYAAGTEVAAYCYR